MSCNCNPCTCSSTCDPSDEPLSSALNNFIIAFFGTVTKTCVNNQFNWSLPCDLDAGVAGYPRLANEGIACYLLRVTPLIIEAASCCVGLKGYTLTTLTNVDVTLTADVSTVDQQFNGTLTGPVDINALLTNAENGDKFSLSIVSLGVTAVNNLAIQSNGVNLVIFNTPGTLSGFVELTYTGTAWVITKQYTDLV